MGREKGGSENTPPRFTSKSISKSTPAPRTVELPRAGNRGESKTAGQTARKAANEETKITPLNDTRRYVHGHVGPTNTARELVRDEHLLDRGGLLLKRLADDGLVNLCERNGKKERSVGIG